MSYSQAPGLVLAKASFILAMEAQEHILLINGLVIQAQGRIPGGGAAPAVVRFFTAWNEKCGEVRKAAGALSVALGADAVGSVSHHGHPADLPLQVTLGGEQGLLILRNGEDRVVIRQDAAQSTESPPWCAL